MSIQRKFFALAVAVTVTIPAIAVAESEFHPANGEIGYTQHPSHAKPSNVTRDQVTAEVDVARKEGWFYRAQRFGIFPSKDVSASKSREQVLAEMRAETPAQRNLRIEQSKGGQ